jgi:iron complex outermembrane receptor protein
MLPNIAFGQSSATLDEIVVQGATPRPRPAPARQTGSSTTPAAAPQPSTPAPPRTSPALSVVSTTPVTGVGFDRNKVPAMVQTVTAPEFQRADSPSVLDALQQRIPGVHLSDTQGNNLFQDLQYRGFFASPLQGTPQGLAVYINGIRINEAFGDTVNFDFIPTMAVGRADVWTNNPAFGLNALGGAISFQMKDGFTFQGFEFDAMGGSYGRIGGSFQYGVRNGEWAMYMAGDGVKDDGWRYQSPSRIGRFYADLGWKGTDAEIHLIGTAADNFFGVVGPTPVEMLNRNWRSVYTFPQTTKNQAQILALHGRYSVSDNWTVQSNVYVRNFKQKHVDGNDADVEECTPGSNTLCLDEDAFVGLSVAERTLRDQYGNQINCPPGSGCELPYGTVDRTRTQAVTVGGSLQGTYDGKIFGRDNHFTIGASIDRSKIGFGGDSELGYIYPDFFVGPNGPFTGTGVIIHTDSFIGYAPVDLNAKTNYYGFYGSNTYDVTDRLSLTAGARYNLAKISMVDNLGTSPDLNGNYTFSRLNPVFGFTLKIAEQLTLYGGYSEANRAPTPLELGCANPERPCLIEGFLASDPPLQQVIARTREIGIRGQSTFNGDGLFDWKLGLFRTDNANDIISVASTIQGRGVFQNVEGTRRQGLEAGANWRTKNWLAYLNYAFIDATYQFEGEIASPNNPMANDDGFIFVRPGNQIPGIPRHLIKGGFDYMLTPQWKVGMDAYWVGSQWYVGDDANQNVKIADYWVANAHASYQYSKEVKFYGVIKNLFNRHYATNGRYFGIDGVQFVIPNPPTDPRTVTPGTPLAFYLGVNVKM